MADFSKIINRIDDAISVFIERIPASQTDMLHSLDEQLRKLDLSDGKIKPTVANLRLVSNIKSKLLKVILTDAYKSQVKQFLRAFNDITTLQNQYWKSVEKTFKPSSILKQIKKITVEDTAAKLMEAGMESNVAEPIKQVLNTNITQGGSYRDMQKQIAGMVTTTLEGGVGLLDAYTKRIVIDSVNQYSRNYTQIASSDLGYEWYAYSNTLVETSRPFCKAMRELDYFHISQIPDLLEAKDLYYTKKNKDGTTERLKVPLNPKTNLPEGMYPGTNVSNFLTLLGGYNCGHQPRPVSANLVKMQEPVLYEKIINSSKYKSWKSASK